MGCGTANASYNESQYDEEIELRNFEIEIGGYKKTLNNVLPRICIEKDLVSEKNLEEFILQDFSPLFLSAIKNDFFFKFSDGKRYYDAKKINLLLFLLTNDSIVNNGNMKYHDKASFVVTYVKNNEEDDLNFPLQKHEDNFVAFVGDLYDIATIGLVDTFIKIKNVTRQGFLQKLRNHKEQAVERCIEELFKSKNKSDSEGLGFKQLNEKFEENGILFTAGFMREHGFECLKASVAEEEKKKQEAELQKKK